MSIPETTPAGPVGARIDLAEGVEDTGVTQPGSVEPRSLLQQTPPPATPPAGTSKAPIVHSNGQLLFAQPRHAYGTYGMHAPTPHWPPGNIQTMQIWPHATQEQRGAEAVFEGPPLFVAQSKKRRMSAEQDPKACKSSRLEATRRHVQNRGLESTRDSLQEVPVLESGSGLSHNFEGGSTGSPELASTAGQPTGLNKTAQNREFIANLAIPASTRPTNPAQTLTLNSPTPDSSITTTTAQRRFWAGRVKAAIKNTGGHIQGKPYKLWKKGNDVGSILSPETSEYISYKIVDIAERLHIQGVSSLHIFKPEMLKDIKKTRTWTFQQRMEHVIKLVCFWKSRCEAFLVGNGIEECVAMPYQKMIDALQMVPENRKRQGLLKKGKAKETADVGVGLPRQDGDAEVNVEAPSTSVVGESTGLIDEAPAAVDHRETTPPTMVPATFQERDKSTASDADIEDPGPRSVAVVYPSSDDDAKYPIDQLTQSDEEEGTTPAETSMS